MLQYKICVIFCVLKGVVSTGSGENVWFVDGMEDNSGHKKYRVSGRSNLVDQTPPTPTSRPNYFPDFYPDAGEEVVSDTISLDDDAIVFEADDVKPQRFRRNRGERQINPERRARRRWTIKTAAAIVDATQNMLLTGSSEDEMIESLRTILNVSQPLLEARRGFDFNLHRNRGDFALAEPAACQPELVTVPIVFQNSTETKFIYPSCTRLRRCGGCCNHELLTCLPSKVTYKKLSILVLDTETGVDSKEVIEMEEHESCTCGCVVQPYHCNHLQRHYPDECECRCLEVSSCPADKTWDPATCSCVCTQPEVQCSTGLSWDTSSCRCEKLYRRLEPVTSRPPYNSRTKYNSG